MTDTSTEVLTLRANIADYPVTKAMKDGRVRSDLVTLDFCGPKTAHDGFKPMLREGRFDVGELAIITYLQARAYGKPFVLLPAPISGRLQHHCIGYNRELGQLDPKDVEGRKVGVRTYAQTTGLWVRGILQHDYGVDLDKVAWMTIDESHLAEYRDPANCVQMAAGSSIAGMMLDGDLAAAILGNDMPDDPRIATLIPNAKEAGKAWMQREGVVPINHMMVVHESIARERPDIVREIYRMVAESRALTDGGPPAIYPPMGYAANRKALQMAIDWSYEQKIIPRRLSIDELFDETTASLG